MKSIWRALAVALCIAMISASPAFAMAADGQAPSEGAPAGQIPATISETDPQESSGSQQQPPEEQQQPPQEQQQPPQEQQQPPQEQQQPPQEQQQPPQEQQQPPQEQQQPPQEQQQPPEEQQQPPQDPADVPTDAPTDVPADVPTDVPTDPPATGDVPTDAPVTDAPTEAPTPTPTPPTESVPPTEEPLYTETQLSPGSPLLYIDGKLSSFDTQLVVGSTVTIAVPFVYTESVDGSRISFASHMGYDGKTLKWSPSSAYTDFDQRTEDEADDSFMSRVTHLEVYPAGEVPFVWNQNEPVFVVAQVNGGNVDALSSMGQPVIGERVNLGYALFRDVKVRKDLGTGYYPISLNVVWFDMENGNDLQQEEVVIGSLNVKAKSSGGGGYGGGGGIAEPTPLPKTQLLIDGLTTDPKTVKAGDEFDLTLSLTNTSAVQKAQNIRLTLAAQDDAILPVAGSSTLYIDAIGPGEKKSVTLRMEARPDIAVNPVKIDASLEYEDSKLTEVTASQSVVMNVEQQQRVRLDDPVVPLDELYPGDETTVTMGIYNTGHTTLYNVTARVVSEGGQLTAQQSYYAGNMESGASKTAEIDVLVGEAGQFNGAIEVTFEDANGNLTTESKSFTMSAMEMPTYDDPEYMEPPMEEMPEVEEPSPVTEILQSPIYMLIIGAAAMGLLSGVIALIVHHRRKARDDEYEDF